MATETHGWCLFCCAEKSVTVSAWPDWATQLVADASAVRYSPEMIDKVTKQIITAAPQGYLREDFIATRKLRVACKRCHKGWMSRIDAKARSVLLPLIRGDGVVLLPAVQEALAAWIAKTIMITEFASTDRVVTPEAERAQLRQTTQAPRSWNIWIAYNNARNWEARYVRHAANLCGAISRISSDKRPVNDTHSVSLGMGKVLVHIMASTVSGMKFQLPNGRGEAFHTLWPVRDAISWPPRISLNKRQVESFSTTFNRDFGLPEVGLIGAVA